MNQWPTDLATAVLSSLPDQAAPEVAIRALFETMYFASLRTEEGVPIVFHIVYLNPENPDPKPPKRILQDRWTFVALQERLPFSVSAITKIANASDPRSSSLAVYHDNEGKVFIWGFIDQGNSYYDFVTYNENSGPERPGLFQASIVGVGHIIAFQGYKRIADLHNNRLRKPAIDALGLGPLHQVLAPSIQRFINQVMEEVGSKVYEERSHWDGSLCAGWLASLRRLLLRIQQYRHGGAVLITPHVHANDLNIKYGLAYDRLRTSLQRNAITTIKRTYASDQIFHQYLDKDSENISSDLYLNEAVASNDLDEIKSELDGALWFISLLSRVDGVILLTPDLEVKGFGVEIKVNEPPAKLVEATDERATKKKCISLDYNHFGTRHRSMMRYCAKVPGSVGLVISQDGDVRAMTQIKGTLVFWDNLQLRLDDFDRGRNRKR